MAIRPFTGNEFLESLRGPREIWIYGERVQDVTTHPAFRNPARMLARLYDALHDPAQQAALTCPTDTGSGGFTHKFFRAPTQRRRPGRGARRDRRLGAPDLWLDGPLARLQGRLPRHPRRQRRLLRALPGQRPALVSRRPGARAVHEPRARPPAGRPPPPAGRGRRRLRARGEGDRRRPDRQRREGGGHRLGAHALQLHRARRRLPLKTKEFAPIFIVAMDTPGVKLICRPSYAHGGRGDGQPLRLPALVAAWTRTTPSWSSTGRWSRGRTSSSTRTWTRPTPSSRTPASSRAPCSRAARAWRSSSTSSPACS